MDVAKSLGIIAMKDGALQLVDDEEMSVTEMDVELLSRNKAG